MTAATASQSCPPWCINRHLNDDDVHLEVDHPIHPGNLSISAYQDRGRPGVYVGSYELTPAQAREAAAVLLRSADLAETGALAVTR